MKIAREGFIFIYPLILLNIFLSLLLILNYIPLSLLIIAVLVLLFCLNFFRDPLRKVPKGENIIISPADGKVIKMEHLNDNDLGEAIIVSIFLNIFDVHVNRMPIKGKIVNTYYEKGKFLMAFNHKACDENERNTIKVITQYGELKIIQIAGLLARRIMCYAKTGQFMDMGSRLGFMRFGSRIDLIIPVSIKLKIVLGQKVIGNKTIIGTF